MLVPTSAPPQTPVPQRRRARRLVLAVIAIAWIVVGFIGAYSYLDNYYLHRGFATPQRLAEAGAGRLLSVHFYSRALHKIDSYLVYLPSGYRRSRRYPVFYLLHGLPGRSVSFTVIGHIEIKMENLISEHRMGPMILVFPDGRIDGNTFSDSEWANTPSGAFDSSVIDVVHNVDHRFATRRRSSPPRDRGTVSRGVRGDQHRASPPANVRLAGGVVGVLHRDAYGCVRPRQRRRSSPTTARSSSSGRSDPCCAATSCARSCSWAARIRPAPRSRRWRERCGPRAQPSATRSTQAVMTGSCGTSTSIRC